MIDNNPMVNIDAEESLLGGLMILGINGTTPRIDQVMSSVVPGDFFVEAHHRIFLAMQTLHRKNRPIDLLTISDEIGNEHFGYIGEISKNVPSASNVLTYARIVKDKSAERRTFSLIQEAGQIMMDTGDTGEKISAIQAILSGIDYESDKSGGLIRISDFADQWLETLDDRMKNPGNYGYSTGIKPLDELFGAKGINKTDLIVLAGRPKMGKSQLAVKIAEHVALELRLPVAIFNMEMSRDQVLERQLSQHSRLSTDKFYEPLDDDEWALVAGALSQYADADVYIDDRPNRTLGHIEFESRKLKRQLGKLGVVLVDYLTLMELGLASRHDLAVGNVSKGLKNLAKELECPVLLLSQLSRGVEQRPNKRPMASDLRDSGQIEQDADRIVFCYREEIYNHDTPLLGTTEIIVAANRHGRVGTVYQDMVDGNFVDIDLVELNARQGRANGTADKPFAKKKMFE
jgi:replicative DNA helicase